MAVLALCVVLVLGAVMGPPGRGNSSYRTAPVLRAMGVAVHEASGAADVAAQVDASMRIAHGSYCGAAVLIAVVLAIVGIRSRDR